MTSEHESTRESNDSRAAHGAASDPQAIELDLPLHARYAATVRVVAASLAADLAFTVDEIDDLRVGVSEAVSVLCDVESADAVDGRLHVRFVAHESGITVTAARRGTPTQITPSDLDDLAARILRAVVDEFSVDGDGNFVVSKRHANDDG